MGELIDIRSGNVIDSDGNEVIGGPTMEDALDRLDAAEPPLIPSGEYVERRVRLSRQEFAAVAAGEYPEGRTPDAGPPTVTVVDKRGNRNPTAAAAAAERQAREQQRQAQETWTRQAAGTMFWEAQRLGAVDPQMGEAILAKRAELVAGATKKGILR
ncbi:hypothetical protein SEA_ZENTENO07_82 [Mycobacterium phage Zenteno07]|nr:hypothetical protein SEA_ZENTENO07_82 [Mycobacterium phage Zenteno07]